MTFKMPLGDKEGRSIALKEKLEELLDETPLDDLLWLLADLCEEMATRALQELGSSKESQAWEKREQAVRRSAIRVRCINKQFEKGQRTDKD